jgi:cytochrome b subunit of formate dehydrogenase
MTDTLPRFTPRQRVEHVLVMTTFTVLAVTGFPQKFYDATWAHWIVSLVGGVERLRWIHRMTGLLFALLTVSHVALVTLEVATGKARASLVPARKDFSDAILTLRYYLGLADHPAAFDRFDYRQKFVITWHIYNAHLSPDVFPFDTSIFTGRISRARMRHEHPLELQRIEREEAAPQGR